jgi:hypothetical protein
LRFDRSLSPRFRGREPWGSAAFIATLPPHPALCTGPSAHWPRPAAKLIQFDPSRVWRPLTPACGTLPHGQDQVPPARQILGVPNPVSPLSGTKHAAAAPSGGNSAPPWGDSESGGTSTLTGCSDRRVINPQRSRDYDADEELNDTEDRSFGPQWHRKKGPETRKPRSH